ncbi:MAG: hypothetical protein IJ828_09725 [Treponema sp.]|nr:hypothetical protein [Treponema sp.]
MKLKKLAAAVFSITLIAVSTASSLEVDEDEIRRTGDVGTIQFENYTGPHSVIETADTITEIGRGLGRQARTNISSAGTYGLYGKYTIIHAIDPNTKDKFDADILVINPNATVDHIRNLRRIIAGYLSAAYGYNASDASTLATFVTVYNAVYRGKMDVFRSRYKDVVTKNLTEDKCGLSTKWSEWPGRTQIVIPLYDINGGLSSIDTTAISDKNVIDSMREKDDKGIDERKNLVDIKEREAEDAAEKAQESAKVAAQDADKLKEQQKQQASTNQNAQNTQKEAQQAQQNAQNAQKEAQQAQQNAQNAQKEAQQAQQNAQKNPNDAAAQEDALKKQQEAKALAEAAAKKEQEAKAAQEEALRKQKEAEEAERKRLEEQKKTEELQKIADESSQKAAEEKAFAEQKEAEAQRDRTEIAKDIQALLDDSLTVAETNTVIGLKVVDEAKDLSQMVKISATDGSIVRLSPVTVVHRRIIMPVSGQELNELSLGSRTAITGDNTFYMAICGDKSASNNSAVKLCLLDSGNMEIQKESVEIVADNSVLVTDGTNYYCVIQDGTKWVVGKYNKALTLLIKSPVEVEANTPITVSSKGVVVTAVGGKLVLLDNNTLDRKF